MHNFVNYLIDFYSKPFSQNTKVGTSIRSLWDWKLFQSFFILFSRWFKCWKKSMEANTKWEMLQVTLTMVREWIKGRKGGIKKFCSFEAFLFVTDVIYWRVLSSCRVQLNLWYKAHCVLLKHYYSVDFPWWFVWQKN